MSGITRISVSLDKKLLEKFDRRIRAERYPTRSKAIEDLITKSLVKQEWVEGGEVAGAVIMVYDHHRRNLTARLTEVQHRYHHLVVSTLHIHLDRGNCLEIVVIKGRPHDVEALALKLKATKGVKHASLAMATTGKGV